MSGWMLRLREVRPTSSERLAQRDDVGRPGGGQRVRAVLRLVPGRVDPQLRHPVERARRRAGAGRRGGAPSSGAASAGGCRGRPLRRGQRPRHAAGGEVVAAALAEQGVGDVRVAQLGQAWPGAGRQQPPTGRGVGAAGAGCRAPRPGARRWRRSARRRRRSSRRRWSVSGRADRRHGRPRDEWWYEAVSANSGGLGRRGVQRHLVRLVDAALEPNRTGLDRRRCRPPCAAGWWPPRCPVCRPAVRRDPAWSSPGLVAGRLGRQPVLDRLGELGLTGVVRDLRVDPGGQAVVVGPLGLDQALGHHLAADGQLDPRRQLLLADRPSAESRTPTW